MEDVPERCQRMIHLLSAVQPFQTREEDQEAALLHRDPDKVYNLIGSWWSSFTRNKTERLPRAVVPVRLNFLHQNYLERATAGEESEALLRHVIRIVEIMEYVHELVQRREGDRTGSAFGDTSGRSSVDGAGGHQVGNLTIVQRPHSAAAEAVSGRAAEMARQVRLPSWGSAGFDEEASFHRSENPVTMEEQLQLLTDQLGEMQAEIAILKTPAAIMQIISDRSDIRDRIMSELNLVPRDPHPVTSPIPRGQLVSGVQGVSPPPRVVGNGVSTGLRGHAVSPRTSSPNSTSPAARRSMENAVEEELGRAERMLRGIDVRTIMRDDLNTVCKVVTPEIDKIKQNVWSSLGKYYKFADPNAVWENRCRARLTAIQKKKDEITEEFVSSGGKQEASVAMLHQDLKPFTGTESTSIFEYLKHVEIATHSMGNRSERSTMVINRYLDAKVKGQFAAFACRPYTELRTALISRFGKIPEIISRIQSSTLKTIPPAMNAPPKEIHMHLVEIHTTLNRIQALRDLPEVNDAEVTQVIHARDFQITFQSKWAEWLGAEFTGEMVKNVGFNSADYNTRYRSMLKFIEVKMKAYDLIVDDLNAFKYAHPGEKKKTTGDKGTIRVHAAHEPQQEEQEEDLELIWNTHYANSAARFECVLQNHTGHNIYNCKEFLKMTPDERLKQSRGKKCFTCLGGWGLDHRKVCPGAKDLPKEVICAQCNPSGERFPMNVLFCSKQGHKKPTPRVFLDAMKKYRPDMDTSPATEKIIKIMMSGRHSSSDREQTSIGKVKPEALNLRQTLLINEKEVNVYYDTGAGTSLVCKSAAVELALPRIGKETVRISNLGETIQTKVGQYLVKCTMSNQKQRAIELQGIPDLKWELTEVNLDEVNCEAGNKNLGALPQRVEGGPVGIVLGIDEPDLMPVFLYTLPSGVAVYRSAFRDKDGSSVVYGGCHASFTEQCTDYGINGLMSRVRPERTGRRTSTPQEDGVKKEMIKTPGLDPSARSSTGPEIERNKVFSSRVFINSSFRLGHGNGSNPRSRSIKGIW